MTVDQAKQLDIKYNEIDTDNRAILIHAACIGYDAKTAFTREAPNQSNMWSRIDWEARHGTSRLRTSIEEEGLSEEWGLPLNTDIARAKL
jgi:hypothetical protein